LHAEEAGNFEFEVSGLSLGHIEAEAALDDEEV
jgi:hypothetical protein